MDEKGHWADVGIHIFTLIYALLIKLKVEYASGGRFRIFTGRKI